MTVAAVPAPAAVLSVVEDSSPRGPKPQAERRARDGRLSARQGAAPALPTHPRSSGAGAQAHPLPGLASVPFAAPPRARPAAPAQPSCVPARRAHRGPLTSWIRGIRYNRSAPLSLGNRDHLKRLYCARQPATPPRRPLRRYAHMIWAAAAAEQRQSKVAHAAPLTAAPLLRLGSEHKSVSVKNTRLELCAAALLRRPHLLRPRIPTHTLRHGHRQPPHHRTLLIHLKLTGDARQHHVIAKAEVAIDAVL